MIIGIRTCRCENRSCKDYHKDVLVSLDDNARIGGTVICVECRKSLTEIAYTPRKNFSQALIVELEKVNL